MLIVLGGFLPFDASLATAAQHPLRTKLEFSTEYLRPIHENRQIDTRTLNLLFGWERWPEHPFTFLFGLSLTHAAGEISQRDENFTERVLPSEATGLGPVFKVKFEPFVYRRLSAGAEIWGGVILYSDHFPAGGDIYNFMQRAGFSVSYRTRDGRHQVQASWKWMHVSNGQGIGDYNPSYEGSGPGVSWNFYFN